MANPDVWPVVFVAWNSKAQEALELIQKGQLEVWTGKIHIRKGAMFIAITESGGLLGLGDVANVAGKTHDLRVTQLAADAKSLRPLPDALMGPIKAIPRPFLKAPINPFVILPGDGDHVLRRDWFDAAWQAVQEPAPPTVSAPVPTSPSLPEEAKPPEKPPESEREILLSRWIPPALAGLLDDHVRADQWEVTVADALRALGCEVTIHGQSDPGKAVPDCLARYTSPTGQIVELVVDAKAGLWNGAIDDIRAMRDYVALSAPYAFPLFVANRIARDVPDKLRENVMNGKVPRAISGRDLAFLIARRLTDPKFNVEMELRRLLI